jgi:NADP-dependent 3-hydroxy acid dehydrogenase YdfG
VDALVNNAGSAKFESIEQMTEASWNDCLQLNLTSVFLVTQAVLPGMRQRRAGHIIFVSSISGIVPDVSGAAYQAAKRGLIALAHAIRVEEREHGIRTCAVCPGLVDTEILENRPVKPPAEMLAKALRPEDVAEAILAVAKMPPRVSVPEMQVMPTVL